MKPLPSLVTSAVLEAERLAAETELWPGWDPAQTPLVFHGPDIAYLIGHPAPPDSYIPLGAVGGRPIHAGAPTPDMAANTAAEVCGHLSALIMLPDDPMNDAGAYARLILHESFHAHQTAALTKVPRPDFRLMSRYPENDPVNNALAVVENRLLAQAAFTDPIAAAGFLAVRNFRQQRLDGDMRLYEVNSEFNEGTPTYVEMRAGRPAAELVADLHAANVGGKGAAYRRFYATGAALCLVLDRLTPGWQARLSQTGEPLQALLAATVPAPPLEQVLAEAGYAAILAKEHGREQERQRRVSELLDRLEKGPGVRVEIPIPPNTGVLFDPTNVLIVKPGVRLHTRMCGLMGKGIKVMVEHLCLEEAGVRLVTRLPESPTNHPGLRYEAPGFSAQGVQIG